MTVQGFNVRATLSLDDIGLAVDYLSNKDAFEPELRDLQDKITSKGTDSRSDLADVAAGERGQDVLFQRYRRITGYIVHDIDRWNNGKRQELRDRTYNKI